MVERSFSFGAAGADIAALKEMLYAQQELLQKLYIELDVERESSSTAATEALSMILRLQGEKAALMMETSQYRRVAEQKMCHAETSLALFEDLIYQKEMEIASLEFQVQSYRCKLLSFGCDLDMAENKYPDNLIQQTNELNSGCCIRRLQSLPTFEFHDYPIEVEKPLLPSDIIPVDEEEEEKEEEQVDLGPKKHWKKLNHYLEQIKKLDDRVREISDLKDVPIDNYAKLKRESRSRVLISQVSTSILESTRTEIATNLEKMKKTPEKCSMKNAGSEDSDHPSATNIHDVFEVPCEEDIINRVGKQPEGGEIERFGIDSGTVNNERGRLFKPVRDKGKTGKARLVHSRTSVSEYQAELLLLNERMEKIEMNSVFGGQNIGEDDEKLILLREIREQLNVIHSDMRSPEKKKTSSQDEAILLSIQEAMLYFWL